MHWAAPAPASLAGDIVVAPAGTPHKFVSGSAMHRQISIHPAARMETDWLE